MKKINEGIELNEEELLDVNGGNWFTDAWDATCNWAKENTDVLIRVGCIAGGIALCATGIGAGAGLGLIVVESTTAAGIAATGFGSIVGTVVGAAVTGGEEDE